MTAGSNDETEVLRRAIAMHQAGQLANAEELYKRVLAKNKRQFEAIHFLGVLAGQRGRLQEACDLIGRSPEIDASKAEAFANYAQALNDSTRHADALANADRALAINPRFLPAMLARGKALLGARPLCRRPRQFRSCADPQSDVRRSVDQSGLGAAPAGPP